MDSKEKVKDNSVKLTKVTPINEDVTPDDDNTECKDGKDEKPPEAPMVGIFELFRFSDGLDKVLMLIGLICAMASGTAMPAVMIIFGEMTDAFVNNAGLRNYLGRFDLSPWNWTVPDIINDMNRISTVLYYYNRSHELPDVQRVATSGLTSDMQRFAIIYVIVACGVFVLGYGQMTCWLTTATRQSHRIRNLFLRMVLRKHIGWFDMHEIGELNTRLSDDVNKIQLGIGDKLGNFFQWFCAFLAGFIVGFIRGWKLTLVVIAISPLLAISGGVMAWIGSALASKELKAYAKAGAVAEEVIGSLRTVVAFGGQEKECKRYNSNLYDARNFGLTKALLMGTSLGIVTFIMFGSFALAFWYGSKLVREGEYTAGQIIIVFFCVFIGAFAIGLAAPNIQYLATARGGAYAVFQMIDEPSDIDSASTEGLQPDDIEGHVEFKNVFFEYPSRPDVPVLKGFNLKVNVGETVALVGASGCGKSTTVQLIQRFYDPIQGTVTMGGYDISDLNIRYLRQHIGVVSQEPVLFATTIEENVRYGREDVTKEEIEQACKEANAHNFITRLPQGYGTLVGERGAQLSGGQKQRIAIARALISNPKILLLDEATSALDTESEATVQAALDRARMGRTTLVIAHRLSTVRTADKIAGLQNGVVVEQGTHDELMKQGGVYYNLCMSQQAHGVEDDQTEKGEFEAKKSTSLPNSPVKHMISITLSTDAEKKEEDDEDDVKDLPDVPLGRIFRMNSSEWPFMVLGSLGSLIYGGANPAFAVIFAEILGVYAQRPEDQEKDANLYSLLFLLLGAVAGLGMFFQSYGFGRSGEYLTWRIRQLVFKTLLRQDIAYFDDHKHTTGALTTRLATDASALQGATGARLGTICQALCSVGVGVIIGFVFSWKLTLVILGFAPVLAVAGLVQTQMYQGTAVSGQAALEEGGKVATQAIENIRTVASLTKEPDFCEKYEANMAVPYRSFLKKAHISGASYGLSQAVQYFANAAAFSFGAYLIENDGLEFVNMFKVFAAVVFGAMAVGEANAYAPDYGKAKIAAKRIFALFDRIPEIDSFSESGEKPTKCEGAVELRDVSFNYPTRPDIPVLKDMHLKVDPGKRVALVGSSGCGKSTTVQLLERFYDPFQGQVTLDGNNISELHIQWLRSQMGIVSQEPVLFDTSISENIAYGDNSREVDMNEIIEAARNANIHNFIETLPMGYDTNVGDKGTQLSGGQKQRVAIARALLRNPKILLLDEATSALDTESEQVVQEALDRAQEGRTSIVIAHRLSTIQNADCIYVIHNGSVVESGTHQELLSLKGHYYNLNTTQLRKL